MCDVQVKLVAWLDRELPKDEAGAVEHHVERCLECRRLVTAYGQVSETFDAYCDAVMARKTPRQVLRWVPALAGAVVAIAVILLILSRTVVERPPVDPTISSAASLPVPAAPPAEAVLRKIPIPRQRRLPRVQPYVGTEQPMDTAIEIAIPAEAMFPPGAMPNGISFIADLRIAPDGSVRQVHLR